MAARDLQAWLHDIESNHPSEIDMGLARCASVFDALQISFSQQTVITVGGTNGKGTTCAFIENTCRAAGLSVGVFSSPHLESFCERIRINGRDIDDASLCDIFSHIEHAKQDITLTYFEYATLAAFEAFKRANLDIVILEVGLGGRLDAVNIVDPDIAAITSIGLDHQDWLGDTKELIGYEKAGIFRSGIPIIIGEKNCPDSMLQHAKSLGVTPVLAGNDFVYAEQDEQVHVLGHMFDVKHANIPKQNIATGLACLHALSGLLQHPLTFLVPPRDIEGLIEKTHVAGRHQILQARVPEKQTLVIADVAHNEDSAKQLRIMIEQSSTQHCHIVVGMLKDKNIEASLQAFAGLPVTWYCASLPTQRGEHASRLASAAKQVNSTEQQVALATQSEKITNNENSVFEFECVEKAFEVALQNASWDETVLVMGSFLTVAAAIKQHHRVSST